MKTALILSDSKPGHFNQSVAFCKHLDLEYEVVEVSYKSKYHKVLSYLFDRLRIYNKNLYSPYSAPDSSFDVVVSTGSTTYYVNKIIARETDRPNIAILHPKGYRLDFTRIFSPSYDHPPKRTNITELPLNLCAADKHFFKEKSEEFLQIYKQSKRAVGVIIGGPNAVSDINSDTLKKQLNQLFETTEGMERWVTTSRRTPSEIEHLVSNLPFDYKLINSCHPYNPIPAFIHLCDRVFVTSDSASMISECASFGSAKVEILMNRQKKTPNKFEELIQGLEGRNAIHVFDGTLGNADTKIDLKHTLKKSMRF